MRLSLSLSLPSPPFFSHTNSKVEIAIIDPVTKRQVPEGERGEVCIKGAMIMKGYNNLPVRNF